jgi:hypothetical protein
MLGIQAALVWATVVLALVKAQPRAPATTSSYQRPRGMFCSCVENPTSDARCQPLLLLDLLRLGPWHDSFIPILCSTHGLDGAADPTPALPLHHTRLAGDGYVQQVHLAVGDNRTIVVSWVTPRFTDAAEQQQFLDSLKSGSQSPACTSDPVSSVVRYGTSSNHYTRSTEGIYTCYSVGEYDSGLLHSVIVSGLEPNTHYFYTCGDPQKGWSQEYSFTTTPLVGTQSLPYRLGIVGDLGQTVHSADTIDHLLQSEPDLFLIAGDFSYADGDQPRCAALAGSAQYCTYAHTQL